MIPEIVIVQGIDNVGKSTLINNIMKTRNKPYGLLKYSSLKCALKNIKYSSIQHYVNMFKIIESCYHNNIDLILDRAHLGQYVYAQKYRSYSGDYVFDLQRRFDDLCENICLITLEDSTENIANRDDKLSTYSNFQKIEMIEYQIDRFRQAYQKSIIRNKILIKVSDHEQQTLLDANIFLDTTHKHI